MMRVASLRQKMLSVFQQAFNLKVANGLESWAPMPYSIYKGAGVCIVVIFPHRRMNIHGGIEKLP